MINRSNGHRSYANVVQSPRIFTSQDSMIESGNPRAASVSARLTQSMPGLNPILTSPNNVALGRAGSAGVQNNGPPCVQISSEAHPSRGFSASGALLWAVFGPNAQTAFGARATRDLRISRLIADLEAQLTLRLPKLILLLSSRALLFWETTVTHAAYLLCSLGTHQPVRLEPPNASNSNRPPVLLKHSTSLLGVSATSPPRAPPPSPPEMASFPFDRSRSGGEI